MGFFELQDEQEEWTPSGNLDLFEFEKGFLRKFNDKEISEIKYKAEEFGMLYNKKKKAADVYTYGDEHITICPEPLEFIREFDDCSGDAEAANKLFEKKREQFLQLSLEQTPVLKAGEETGLRMWMNKTATGINLRPGILNDGRLDDEGSFLPIRMSDDNVHGLIVGRTGSGKSVFINALILSLITEYAPWELNLYLADFKKVELSRYMNNGDEKNHKIFFTPHVNACAATSEIRYVISLIKYLVDCMNARQEFFARIGVTKIQEFRSKYNLVLPRVLLIVDEFQQLFLEATGREQEEIQTMLNAITKLGRATGFHLIFASQEMSGTLRGSTLANFKIRMALPCNPEISSDILGNRQAVDLQRGYVLVNTDSGDELKNKKYHVPFIESEQKDDSEAGTKAPFYDYLDEIKLEGEKFALDYKTKKCKFYQEEQQESEKDFEKDLDAIRAEKNKRVKASNAIFDGVLLGKTVLYSPKRNDKVSFYIERGRNKGIMIASPNPDDAARIRKLLAENLFRSDMETYHLGIELNNLVFELFRMDRMAEQYPAHSYIRCGEDLAVDTIQKIYYLRRAALKNLKAFTAENPGKDEALLQLEQLAEDPQEVQAFEDYQGRKEELEARIAQLEEEIRETAGLLPKKSAHPITKYLEKCSKDIIIIPQKNIPVDFVNAELYKTVTDVLVSDPDLSRAVQKCTDLLEQKLEVLSGKEKDAKASLAILQNKMLKRAIQFFDDKYHGKSPEITVISDTLEKCYEAYREGIDAYKTASVTDQDTRAAYDELVRRRDEAEEEQKALLEHPNELFSLKAQAEQRANGFLEKMFGELFDALGYRKNRPDSPQASYELRGGQPEWTLTGCGGDSILERWGSDALDAYMNVCRSGKFTANSFRKTVVWLNGLDEIERIPGQFMEIIKDCMNENILIIAMITSELRDTLIRKAFDYAFITGNVEKFYSMFEIKYTKQELDSIVVNFGIRSKGLDMPFKMYKSNLDTVESPDFIDQLLNE